MERPEHPVSDRQAMLAGMTPLLTGETYFFFSTVDPTLAGDLLPDCLGAFREAEGLSVILSEADAVRHGVDRSLPMRRIVLEVFSALDGVGLTAGVASALADAGIPCNMVAAFHHDHVFVPAALAERALEVLQAVQRAAVDQAPT